MNRRSKHQTEEFKAEAVELSLRSKHTQTLALVITDITNSFWATVVCGVEDAANVRGYHISSVI